MKKINLILIILLSVVIASAQKTNFTDTIAFNSTNKQDILNFAIDKYIEEEDARLKDYGAIVVKIVDVSNDSLNFSITSNMFFCNYNIIQDSCEIIYQPITHYYEKSGILILVKTTKYTKDKVNHFFDFNTFNNNSVFTKYKSRFDISIKRDWVYEAVFNYKKGNLIFRFFATEEMPELYSFFDDYPLLEDLKPISHKDTVLLVDIVNNARFFGKDIKHLKSIVDKKEYEVIKYNKFDFDVFSNKKGTYTGHFPFFEVYYDKNEIVKIIYRSENSKFDKYFYIVNYNGYIYYYCYHYEFEEGMWVDGFFWWDKKYKNNYFITLDNSFTETVRENPYVDNTSEKRVIFLDEDLYPETELYGKSNVFFMSGKYIYNTNREVEYEIFDFFNGYNFPNKKFDEITNITLRNFVYRANHNFGKIVYDLPELNGRKNYPLWLFFYRYDYF